MNGTLTRQTDSEGRSEEVEKKKQEQLQKQKEGKGHWEEGLASDSESAVCLHIPSTILLLRMRAGLYGYTLLTA
jgi:hypothetical protein